MVKIVTFPLIYWMSFFIWSYDVNGIESSISVSRASASEIENSESFPQARAKRALALLVPLDKVEELTDESSEELHHKSKRCWRARPVHKIRLSDLEPEETRYNIARLYDNQKRSVKEPEEESWESDESWDNDLEKKYPHLKIVPVNNPRNNLKRFLGTDREMKDQTLSHQSGENSEDVVLKRIKNHLNSDDYNVFALVGKKASRPSRNKHRKYVCYCRENNCSGGNCQRMVYRPCSTCRNSRPVFVGKANDNHYSDGIMNYYRNQERQSTDPRVPLKIQYSASKNQFAEYPVNGNVQSEKNHDTSAVNQLIHKNFQQMNSPILQGRRYQLPCNNPKGVLENPRYNVKPLDQYRIWHVPISTKSAIEHGIPNPRISANSYLQAPGQPATNEYRSENLKFTPDRSSYNQWAVNSYYPLIGNAGNWEIQNRNHQIDKQNLIKLYRSNNELIGTKVPFANEGILPLLHPGSLRSSHIHRTDFGTTQPKIMPNFHTMSNNNKHHDSYYGFDWSKPNAVRAQYHPRQQDIRAPVETLNYQKESAESSQTQVPGFHSREHHRIEENTEGKVRSIESETEGYNVSTENNFDSVTSLETNNYTHSDESQDHDSKYSTYEGTSAEENIPMDGEESVGPNLAHAEDERNVNYVGVSHDQPQKYEIPITYTEKDNNLSGNNKFSDTLEGYKTLESDSAIIESKTLDQGDHTSNSNEDTTFEAQLEKPVSEKSDWDSYNDDTTTPGLIILQQGNNEELSSVPNYPPMYEDQLRKQEPPKDAKIVTAVPKYSDVRDLSDQVSTTVKTESRESTGNYDYSDTQVITNGYFTSKTYDDSQENKNRNNLAEGNNFHQDAEDTNVAMTIDETTTANHFEKDRIHGLLDVQQSGGENLHEPLIRPGNQLLDVRSEHTKYGEVIESSNNAEPGSAEYESVTSEFANDYEHDSSVAKNTHNHNEEDVKKSSDESLPLPTDGNDFEGSNEDVRSNENGFRDHSMEDSLEVFGESSLESPVNKLIKMENNDNAAKHVTNDNYYNRINNEPADFPIEDTPTKYFSPNDRLLEYIKKHSQNLSGQIDPVSNDQRRTHVAPPIYHRNHFGQDESAESDSREFNSGSESDEMITQSSSGNSDEQTTPDVNANQRFPHKEYATLIQTPRYEEREYITSSNCREYIPETKTIPFHELVNESYVGKSGKIQKTFDNSQGNMNESNDDGIYDNDYDYSPEVYKNRSNKMYETVDDHTGEFDGAGEDESNEELPLDLEHREKSAGNEVQVNPNGKNVIVDGLVSPGTDNHGNDYYSTKSTGGNDHGSFSQTRSGDGAERGKESEKISGEMKDVELVSSPQSIECCTKPPEVQDDSGYLGRLDPQNSDGRITSPRDLIGSDLYYIGDGVKLPLTIKKLKDGSFALSISDIICEQRLKHKCPCCVPREGKILQEKHSEKNSKEYNEKTDSNSLHRRAIPDDRKTLEIEQHREIRKSEINDVEKKHNHNKRATRSILPVDEFAEKYNLVLNLNEQLPNDHVDSGAAVSSQLTQNVIQRDEERNDDRLSDDDFVQKLVLIDDRLTENERAGILLSTLQKFIATEPAEAFGLVNGMKKNLRNIKSAEADNLQEKAGESQDNKARYGYQKDNPILDRIKIIKQLENKASRCDHRYQKDCDDAITRKTELFTMILYWLKELVTSKPS